MDNALPTIPEIGGEVQNQPESQPTEKDASTSAMVTGIKRKSSEVWDHFDMIEGSKPKRAACKYCNKSYACESGRNGTSTMLTHWRDRCKKAPHKKADGSQMSLAFKQTRDGSELTSVSYNYDVCRNALAEMIILDELPFKYVEGHGFKRYTNALQPKFDPPGRNTVARDCIKIYLDKKKKLKGDLKGKRVCMTTDTWTSIQNMSYMCLTAHYIDSDWKLQKRILNFCQVPNHRGDTIGKIIEKCMADWGIGSIFTMTLDNASSNNVVIDTLKKKTNHQSGTIMKHSYLHIRCAAHILNLVISDGLSEVNDSVIKIRNAVRYVRSSPSRLAKFKSCAETMKIECEKMVCLDVPTRWNSTYLMLDAAVKYKAAFARLEDDDLGYVFYFGDESSTSSGRRLLGPPTTSDWEEAEVYLEFLKLFFYSTKRVSGFKHVTSNCLFNELFTIETTLNQLIHNNDDTLCSSAKKMKEKFDKYWSWEKINMLLFVALILDPRYKLEYLKFCFGELYGLEKAKVVEAKVKDAFTGLYDFYRTLDGRGEGSSTLASQGTSGSRQVEGVAPRFIVDVASRFRMHLKEKDSLVSASEVDRYLQEKCEEEDDENHKLDILGWWKTNSSKYRVLSRIAMDVLVIPVSSVASESAFSTGGHILDSFRSSLAPKTVEALICSQDWLKALYADVPEPENEFEQLEQIDRELLGSTSTVTTMEIGE